MTIQKTVQIWISLEHALHDSASRRSSCVKGLHLSKCERITHYLCVPLYAKMLGKPISPSFLAHTDALPLVDVDGESGTIVGEYVESASH